MSTEHLKNKCLQDLALANWVKTQSLKTQTTTEAISAILLTPRTQRPFKTIKIRVLVDVKKRDSLLVSKNRQSVHKIQ